MPSLAELAELFPEFEVQACIGRGGMSAVYRIHHRALARDEALKILYPGRPELAQRFAAEARTLARLDHPHIVRVYRVGETAGYPWLTMELIAGGTLREALRAQRLPPEKILPLIPGLCTALQFAHDHGIVHRDLKPENLLISADGSLKIADFGLALDHGEQRLTQHGANLGTPHYRAPEQIEHPQLVDHRADLYALGVVLYELLTGELPLGACRR